MKSTFESCFNDYETTNCTISSASVSSDEVLFLGHVVSPEGIAMDPSKVQDVLD
jgi:hypothetical protein